MDIGPLEPDLAQLLVGLLAFALIFGILGRVLLPRVERVLAERRDRTEGGLERADTVFAEAERTRTAYLQVLAEAHREAARIRQEAAEEGAAVVARAREDGMRERDRLLAEANAQIAIDQALAAVSLREDVGNLAVELAERVVGEPLAAVAAQRGTVARFFDERPVEGN